MPSQNLKIKFEGQGISLGTISSNELADILSSYESALIHTIQKDNPELKDAPVFVSLTNVKEGSAEYLLSPTHKEVTLAAADRINVAIKERKTNTLPYKTVENLNSIWKFTYRRNCKAVLNGSNRVQSVEINPDWEIKIDETFFYTGETTIYGRLERVGGSKPRIRVKLDDDQVVFSDVPSQMAKILATRLYESVALKGLAKWRIDDYSIEEFKALDYILIEDLPIKESIEELGNVIGKYWKKIASPDDYLNNLRYQD